MGYKVLFVDDEDMVLKALKRAMRHENFDIYTASNGEDALRLIAGVEFHLVVSDNGMPGMSGLELLAKIKQEYPETITMMLTGQSQVNVAMKIVMFCLQKNI